MLLLTLNSKFHIFVVKQNVPFLKNNTNKETVLVSFNTFNYFLCWKKALTVEMHGAW